MAQFFHTGRHPGLSRREPSRKWLLWLVLLVPWSAAMATHEADHRYTVWGEVRDAQGTPTANARVRITGLGGRPLGEGTTDSDGRYGILLHLHNDQLGMRFWVTVGDATREAEVTFDPADRVRAREHRLDFPPPGKE